MKAKIAAVVAVLMLPLLFGFIMVTPAKAATQLPDVTWLKGTIDNKSNVQSSLSIAVDGSGSVHISYYDAGTSKLMYATNADGTWKSESVGSANGGIYNSIAVDSNGKAHIAYFDSANHKLIYATNKGGSWATTTIDDGGQYNSIAVDKNNVVHISYQDTNNKVLKYATNAGGSWSATAVDSPASGPDSAHR